MDTKTKHFKVSFSVFCMALILLLILPQVSMAGSDETGYGNDKTGMSQNDMSKEGRQMSEHEGMIKQKAWDTSKMVAESDRLIDRVAMSLRDADKMDIMRIPKEVIDNATGIAVFPEITKAGLIAGGEYGNGILMLNQKDGWRGPLFVSLYGGSLGAQIGVEKTDLIMVFNNKNAIEKLEDGKLTLGADTSVAAGHWGASADTTSNADILVYKHSKGLFAGASVNGAEIGIDEKTNQAFFNNQKGEQARAYYGSEKVLSGEEQLPMNEKVDKIITILKNWK